MEFTSPLTTLGNISTPESFYTARNSPSTCNAADDTTLSSPVEDPPPEEPTCRDAVQMPHELKSHCQIHLEEQLYTAAIHILSGLLSDGNTTTALQHPHHLPNQNLKPKPALIPPPSQIALLTTLIIHPSFTTRPPEISNTHAASHALSYLRGLLSTVGAVNANFRAAFQFGDAPTTTTTSTTTNKNTRYGGPRTGTTSTSSNNSNHNHNNNNSTSDSDDDDDSDDALTGPFARSQLLFRRAPDFWAVLGWAFRCAAEQPRRWRHWRVWLGLAVSVLEADFDERLARDRDRDRDREGVVGRGKGKSVSAYPALGQSLLVGYLRGLGRERRNVLKEVLRGLFAFADGENGVADRAVFREVFERETVVKGAGSGKRKREDTMVDLENDRFGDYLDGDEFESGGEEEDGAGRVPTPKGRRKPGRKPKAEATPSFILTDDIAETVSFRLRIFRLLSAVSYYLPDTFARVDELYERFTDHVRSLPLAMFRLFVEPHPADLPEDVRVSFLRMLIEEMLPRHHPEPADVDPDNASATGVSVLVLQECFLPFPANKVTAEDNAKLSLALESMLWFVYSQIDVAYSPELRQAVEKGIKAREDNIKNKRGGRPDKAAKDVLARSARNLRALVDVIAVAGE